MNKKVLFTAKTLTFLFIFGIFSSFLQGQTLIYYWNFNDNVPGSNENWAQPIAATIGNAEISYTFTEAYSFGGTTINGIDGEENGGSFAPRGGADNINNGEHFTMSVSTAGYQDIILTYPTRRTGTGFTTHEVQYTVDGSSWITKETFDISGFENNWVAGQLITVNFSGDAGVDDNEDFAIRIILTGATSAAGNNRFDNIQINGSQPGAVSPPSNFSASALSTSEIELGWDLNADTDPVLVAWSEDGVFGVPSGTYNSGDPIPGGGTVLYTGSNTSFMHESLDPATTYYYKAWSYDGSEYSAGVTANATTNPMPATTDLPYSENFDEDLGNCYVFSVSGPTKLWNHATFDDNGYAQMNGFNSGDIEEDWLILPGINFDDYENETMSFDTWWRFGEDDDENYLKLFYSSDYPGTGDPSAFAWSELSFNQPTEEQTWGPSGDIDLSGISGELVYIGFKYRYVAGQYKWWQVDNVSIMGDPTGTGNLGNPAAISIGPNPSNGLINVNLPKAGSEIRIYNLTGNLVTQTRPRHKTMVLDLRTFSKGIYILEVVPSDGSIPVRSKIIIQ